MTFTAHFYQKRKALGFTFSTNAKSKGEAVAKLAPLIMQFQGWEWMHIKVKYADIATVAGGQPRGALKKRGVM